MDQVRRYFQSHSSSQRCPRVSALAYAPTHVTACTELPRRDHPTAIAALSDGTRLALRPTVPGDDERLRRMFYRLSPTTIYRRLFVSAPHAPHWADRFAAFGAVDEARRAMAALIGGEVVGIANYCRDTANEAEIAIVVEDSWQGRGVGGLLLASLTHEAVDRHIGVFTARILGDNARALRFVTRRFPAARVQWDGGEYALRIHLP